MNKENGFTEGPTGDYNRRLHALKHGSIGFLIGAVAMGLSILAGIAFAKSQ